MVARTSERAARAPSAPSQLMPVDWRAWLAYATNPIGTTTDSAIVIVSMKMGVWSSAVSGVVVRARGRGGGGERRSCLYRPFWRWGTWLNRRLVAVAQFQSEPSGG